MYLEVCVCKKAHVRVCARAHVYECAYAIVYYTYILDQRKC